MGATGSLGSTTRVCGLAQGQPPLTAHHCQPLGHLTPGSLLPLGLGSFPFCRAVSWLRVDALEVSTLCQRCPEKQQRSKNRGSRIQKPGFISVSSPARHGLVRDCGTPLWPVGSEPYEVVSMDKPRITWEEGTSVAWVRLPVGVSVWHFLNY